MCNEKVGGSTMVAESFLVQKGGFYSTIMGVFQYKMGGGVSTKGGFFLV